MSIRNTRALRNGVARIGLMCVFLLVSSAGIAAPVPAPDRLASGTAKIEADRCTDALGRAAAARDRALQKAPKALALAADAKERSKKAQSHQKAFEQRAAAADRARKSAVAAEAKPAAQPTAVQHARTALREYDLASSEAKSWEQATKELRLVEAQMSTLSLEAAQAGRDAKVALDEALASFKRLLDMATANWSRATATAQTVSGYVKKSQTLWKSASQPAHDASLQTLQKSEEKLKSETAAAQLELTEVEASLKLRAAPVRPPLRSQAGSEGTRK